MKTDDVTDWIGDDAAEFSRLMSATPPDADVPTCPDWHALDLAAHVARNFAGWYCYNISTPVDAWKREDLMAAMMLPAEDLPASVALFDQGISDFVEHCATLDLDQPTWAFGDTEPARWWIRRAAVELTVHLTDAAAIDGGRSSTTPERHGEALDEYIRMWSKLGQITATMGAFAGSPIPTIDIPTTPIGLVADDIGRSWTIARGVDGRAEVADGVAEGVDTTGHGSSSDLLAWTMGRPTQTPMRADGDADLLESWNLFVRLGL